MLPALQIKKVNGIFEMRVKSGKKEGVWTIDLKKVCICARGHNAFHARVPDLQPKVEYTGPPGSSLLIPNTIPLSSQEGKVYQGNAKPKADVTISLADDTFQQVSFESLQLHTCCAISSSECC